jgi:hypothetical protein
MNAELPETLRIGAKVLDLRHVFDVGRIIDIAVQGDPPAHLLTIDFGNGCFDDRLVSEVAPVLRSRAYVTGGAGCD